MFRKSKINNITNEHLALTDTSQRSLTSHSLFTATTPNPILRVFTGESAESSITSAEELNQQVLAFIAAQKQRRLIFMTPTKMRPHVSKIAVSVLSGSEGYIVTGHIHSGCTDEQGKLQNAGDMSFTKSSTVITSHVLNVKDSRLIGFVPYELPVYEGIYSSNLSEINKWCEKVANGLKNCPLYILSLSLKDQADYFRYIRIASALRVNREYSLLKYHNMQDGKEHGPSNCVAALISLHEEYYQEKFLLGHNPSPQAAFSLLAAKHGLLPQLATTDLANDPLAKVHIEIPSYSYVV